MAKGLFYPRVYASLLSGVVQLREGDIRVALLASGVRYHRQHAHLADIAPWVMGVSAPLQNKTFEDGVFDADDTEARATAFNEIAAVALFQQKAMSELSPLIFFSNDKAMGVPAVAYNGQWIDLRLSDGANKIFRLTQTLEVN